MKGTRRRKILIVAVVAILVLLVARTGLDLWAGHRVNVETARLEQRYGSLDARTLTLPPVPAGDNRARAVGAAAALIVFDGVKGPSEFQIALNRFLALKTPSPVPADLRAFVDANRTAIRVADEARSRRQSNWESDFAKGTTSPPLLDIRTLSNALYLAARLDLEAGRPDDAARDIASGLEVAASLRQEPQLISQLIRCAVGVQHFEAVQRLLTQAEPSKASLDELATWLADNRQMDPIRTGLLGEVKYFNAAMMRVEQGNPADLARFWLGPLARFGSPLIRLTRARYLEQMGHLLDVQVGPRPRPASVNAPANWPWMNWLAVTPVAALERTMDTGDVFNGELGATELAVALRRFRLDHGRYPDTLSDVAPAYLANVPIDPFTGRPPVYARAGAGFRLHFDSGRANYSPMMAAALDWTVPH